MTTSDTIDELLENAEKYRFQSDLLALVDKLLSMNPKMDKTDAIKIAYNHFKTQSKLGTRTQSIG